MDIVEQVVRPTAKEPYPIADRLVLTWELRQKSRQRLMTVQGREIALALPTGTRLQAGDLLPTSHGWIEVALAQEDVLLIRPRSQQEMALIAYQIGNRHLPLEVEEQKLKTLYERVLETYLQQHGIPVERVQMPFSPVGAASGHRHG